MKRGEREAEEKEERMRRGEDEERIGMRRG